MWIVGDGGVAYLGWTETWLGRETRPPGRVVIRQAMRREADRSLRSLLGTTAQSQLDGGKKEQQKEGAAPEGYSAGTEKRKRPDPAAYGQTSFNNFYTLISWNLIA